MLSILCVLPLLAPLGAASSDDRELANDAIATMEAAFAQGDSTVKVEALAGAGRVASNRVVKTATQALRDPDGSVRDAAIEALRFNSFPGSLRALLVELTRARKEPLDPERAAALTRAVCQKGQAGAVDALTSGVIDRGSRPVASAWILGLGRLRSPASVAALMDFMASLPAARRTAHMDEFRLSLVALTGVDHGTDSAAWEDWWEERGDDLEVAAERPSIPALLRREWCDYWRIDADEAHPEQFEVGNPAEAREASAQLEADEGAADAEPEEEKPGRRATSQRPVRKDKAGRKKNAKPSGKEAAQEEDGGAPEAKEEKGEGDDADAPAPKGNKKAGKGAAKGEKPPQKGEKPSKKGGKSGAKQKGKSPRG